MSEWNARVKKTYAAGKKKNKNYSMKQAMKDASRTGRRSESGESGEFVSVE